MKTKLTKVVSGVAVAMAMAAFAPGASAQNTATAYPVRLTLRPQTIPQRTVRIDAGFEAAHRTACVSLLGTTSCGGATSTFLPIGGAFGITDDLEVGATLLPLQLTDNFDYGNPVLYGRFRFMRIDLLQLSGDLRITIPRYDGTFGVSVGVPVWFYLSEMLQLQTGLYYEITGTSPELDHRLRAPVALNINVTENLHIGVNTGITLPFVSTGERFAIPLGVEVGYAIAQANNRPIVDLVGFFRWSDFLVPGSSGDVVQTGTWSTGLNARVYLFL